ncbi:MAG: type I-U CRISPR-associated RAMP protein Csb1/Cas7u [Rhodospirillaceae bacterium]|nr:type I-U CRISPR-associated RAMP protein Csb1/Cas7u [Rhodospirillaceae bacterium]
MNQPLALAPEIIDNWADDTQGPVALHLKQKLLPVELDGKVIYPPTYADIGYNLNTLSDGTKVVTIDSVGSQANRMEPIFKFEPYSSLVPQIQIELHSKGEGEEKHVETRSLLDLAHRSADAVVHASPTLSSIVAEAFRSLRQRGDAGPLCRVAPTSLVFGVWDSRGESNEKRPRLVRSIIRAWDVEPLHAAAQFNSVWKSLDDNQKTELDSKARDKKVKLSEKGFKDTPAIFRKTNPKVSEFRDGVPNPERRVLGGVLVNGSIERDVTINLIALRALGGANGQETRSIHRYLLALTLLAATAEIELSLREGCHLRFADDDRWNMIPRRGNPTPVDLVSESSRKTLLAYAQRTVENFSRKWPKLEHKFDLSEAKKLLAKKAEKHEEVGS